MQVFVDTPVCVPREEAQCRLTGQDGRVGTKVAILARYDHGMRRLLGISLVTALMLLTGCAGLDPRIAELRRDPMYTWTEPRTVSIEVKEEVYSARYGRRGWASIDRIFTFEQEATASEAFDAAVGAATADGWEPDELFNPGPGAFIAQKELSNGMAGRLSIRSGGHLLFIYLRIG